MNTGPRCWAVGVVWMRFGTRLVPVAALRLLAACGDNRSARQLHRRTVAPVATGDPGTDAIPKTEAVKLPAEIRPKLVITDVKRGTGTAAVSGDTLIVLYVGVGGR